VRAWYPRSLLLTDIVDSVALWEQRPDAMSAAVDRHEAIVQDSVISAGGEMVRTKGEGDSTFSVFTHPAEAVSAAVAVQRAVGSESWPTAVPLRVRAGLHTGDAERRGGDWYGPAVNRAARLRGLAGGGQTLVSGLTAGLVADRLPEGVRLLYRGRRVLRGIERPEEVWEVVGVGDPRLAAISERLAGLPGALTSFVAHGADVDNLVRLAADERLVTLTGPGGSGKTRLVLEAAREFLRRDEMVWFADLSPLRAAEAVAGAVADAVGLGRGLRDPLQRLLAGPELLT
jgi:class 3 adenylate cyclase